MITKPSKQKIISVNLDGPDGNAYALLGMSQRWCKDLGIDWNKFEAEATCADYRKLILTFEKHFGAYVKFVTNQKELLHMNPVEIEADTKMKRIDGEVDAKMKKMGYTT